MKMLTLLTAISLLCTANLAAAQYTPLNVVSGNSKTPTETGEVVIKELGWMDHNKMEQEITAVNDLAKLKLGLSLHQDLSDLTLLQRLVDGNWVARDDYETQQAMGVVLGNVMIADFPSALEWKVYEDKLGRSRAVCAKRTTDCLFPVTMLSRRMEVGTKPNVRKIYDDAILLLEKHLPKVPYDGGILYRLPRQQ